MNVLSTYERAYFVGIGGIGMSALARYFMATGKAVMGYDKVASALTQSLIEEGILVHFEDSINEIPEKFKDPNKTLIVYTPAIKELAILDFFENNKFSIKKRAEVLGDLTRSFKGLCIAGTHGKTTTSSLLAHLLNGLSTGCTAFLGGIANNFNSNLVISQSSKYAVIEADEFDRSFLHLAPFAAIVTATDPDHLDVYGNKEAFVEGFRQFTMRVDPKGFCIQKFGLQLQSLASVLTYELNNTKADYTLVNLRFEDGFQVGDLICKSENYPAIAFGLPGLHNAENALACIALLHQLGYTIDALRPGLKSFEGVRRRFDYHLRTNELIYIDDYAHHPVEIEALLNSVKLLYPSLPIIGIFQPHLYSRTKDFASEFAQSLNKLDQLYLLPIYPARELPIPGVSSEWLCTLSRCEKKQVLETHEVLSKLKNVKKGVVLTIGAGDIDRLVAPIKAILESQTLAS